MSRIGKKLITVSSGVKVKLEGNIFHCQGPKGILEVRIPDNAKLTLENNEITVSPLNDEKIKSKSLLRSQYRKSIAAWGTTRQLVMNSIQGVTEGFKKSLVLEGVGFKAEISGRNLNLAVGYSKPVSFALPSTVKANVENNTKIILDSCDKQILGETAAKIRDIRKPEPYKGKGIRYEGEVIKRKAGKSGKK